MVLEGPSSDYVPQASRLHCVAQASGLRKRFRLQNSRARGPRLKMQAGGLRYTKGMEIITVPTFLDYYEKIRQRTLRVVRCVPADKMEWSPQPGKFTIGDLIRHLASIERDMYAENVQNKQSRYRGHGLDLASGAEEVLKLLETTHRESMEIFASLTNEDLQKKCITPDGAPITTWKWLRAMVEHEVHHRGQIYLYLALLEVPTPPLYGLTSEDVRQRSIG